MYSVTGWSHCAALSLTCSWEAAENGILEQRKNRIEIRYYIYIWILLKVIPLQSQALRPSVMESSKWVWNHAPFTKMGSEASVISSFIHVCLVVPIFPHFLLSEAPTQHSKCSRLFNLCFPFLFFRPSSYWLICITVFMKIINLFFIFFKKEVINISSK